MSPIELSWTAKKQMTDTWRAEVYPNSDSDSDHGDGEDQRDPHSY